MKNHTAHLWILVGLILPLWCMGCHANGEAGKPDEVLIGGQMWEISVPPLWAYEQAKDWGTWWFPDRRDSLQLSILQGDSPDDAYRMQKRGVAAYLNKNEDKIGIEHDFSSSLNGWNGRRLVFKKDNKIQILWALTKETYTLFALFIAAESEVATASVITDIEKTIKSLKNAEMANPGKIYPEEALTIADAAWTVRAPGIWRRSGHAGGVKWEMGENRDALFLVINRRIMSLEEYVRLLQKDDDTKILKIEKDVISGDWKGGCIDLVAGKSFFRIWLLNRDNVQIRWIFSPIERPMEHEALLEVISEVIASLKPAGTVRRTLDLNLRAENAGGLG